MCNYAYAHVHLDADQYINQYTYNNTDSHLHADINCDAYGHRDADKHTYQATI